VSATACTALALLLGLALLDRDEPVADPVSADPPDGARLADAPSAVSLTFPDSPDPRRVQVTVTGPGGAPVSSGPPSVAGGTVVQPVTVRSDGEFLVVYHVVLADGSDRSGITRFSVGPAPAGPPPAAADDPHAHSHGGSLGFLVSLLAVVVAGAVLMLGLRSPRPADPSSSPD
jgi:methionine-rich copper-binding protein CopC